MLRMIEPLLTSCQKGPLPRPPSPSLPCTARSVGSGAGLRNSHGALVFQFVWRRQTLSSSSSRKKERGRENDGEEGGGTHARRESFCVKLNPG